MPHNCAHRKLQSTQICDFRDISFCGTRNYAGMRSYRDECREWLQRKLAEKGRGSKIDLAKHMSVKPETITRMLATAPGKETREIKAVELMQMAEFFGEDAPMREPSRVTMDEVFPKDPDPDRAMAEASVGIVPEGVPADAILQPDFHAGLGGGGVPLQIEVTTPDGQNFTGEGVRDWWRIPPQVLGSVNLRPRLIRAFQAQGDSMIPTIDDGDVVFADVSHRVPSPPGLYVLDDGFGGVLVKRLSVETMPGEDPVMVRVASDNEAYPTHMREADNVRIIGRYIGMFTMRNRR